MRLQFFKSSALKGRIRDVSSSTAESQMKFNEIWTMMPCALVPASSDTNKLSMKPTKSIIRGFISTPLLYHTAGDWVCYLVRPRVNKL